MVMNYIDLTAMSARIKLIIKISAKVVPLRFFIALPVAQGCHGCCLLPQKQSHPEKQIH